METTCNQTCIHISHDCYVNGGCFSLVNVILCQVDFVVLCAKLPITDNASMLVGNVNRTNYEIFDNNYILQA